MDLSPAISILKEFEGFESKAYWDATGKVWTIGYGETVYPDGRKVKKGDTCTQAQALAWLLDDIKAERLPAILKGLKVQITNNQLCALISFCYNVGNTAFQKSTLLRKLNAHQPDHIVAKEFHKWNKSGGKVLKGLVRRRKAEAQLFLAHGLVDLDALA